MFLKRIILKNFKSFSGKTVLDFPCLFTAIVGPNGSGKSNIVHLENKVLKICGQKKAEI
jgi:chromosome segregation protein